jgi:hypothetical protein
MCDEQNDILSKITYYANETSEINKFMESLILPYQYFKKLNILPFNMVEEEMDKYFDIKHLLLQNYFNLPYVLKRSIKLYELPISNITLDNYSKYYNNFPLHLITDNCGGERPIKEDIIRNLDKFNNVLEESDYCVWTNRIFNMVETIFHTNLRKTEKYIEHYNILNKEIEEKILKKKSVDNLVVGDIIEFEYYNRLGEGPVSVNKYKVLKLNPKTIKFVEVLSSNCLNTPKNRVVKYDRLRVIFQNSNYEVYKE